MPVSTRLVAVPLTVTMVVPVADNAPVDTPSVKLNVSSTAALPSPRPAFVNSKAEDSPAVICRLAGMLLIDGAIAAPPLVDAD